ncbi:hypothetical protein K458DRAFT_390170 [Lentithecium fluviatile CBS 122367]|uniref:Uncharacterized protein n=1 Tax=Lentithecium fluviatile CBS 122367 TaxID=1168545 RepID=A0A6G1IXC8_9PLEO|nr:hypothetical protein K458DRAFT_390170 [Lentithecium fluviatile CBS 122367]
MPHPPLRTLTPTLLSLILPLILRLYTIHLHPFFLPLGLYALLTEKGYRETLEWLTPEFSEHTGPFSHIGVCLLAQLFVQDMPGWRGEVLFWTVFVRWAVGVERGVRRGIDSFKDAYKARFKGTLTRVHAILAATALTPIFVTQGVELPHVVVIWLHFYHCVGFMIAAWNYCCLPRCRKPTAAMLGKSKEWAGN